jgi:hypothetical protein
MDPHLIPPFSQIVFLSTQARALGSHTFPVGQVPHCNVPLQLSEIEPHVTFSAAQLVGLHVSAPPAPPLPMVPPLPVPPLPMVPPLPVVLPLLPAAPADASEPPEPATDPSMSFPLEPPLPVAAPLPPAPVPVSPLEPHPIAALSKSDRPPTIRHVVP